MSSRKRKQVNARLEAFHRHLLTSTAVSGAGRQVTHFDVLDNVIGDPERALERYLPAMFAGRVMPCAAETIFSHLLRAPGSR